MNLGIYTYLGAAAAYGFFAILLLFSWRGSLQGKFLTAAVIVSTIWAGLAAKVAHDGTNLIWLYLSFETLRYIAWYAFLFKLFDPAAARNAGYRKFLHWALPFSVGFACLLLAYNYFGVTDQPGLVMAGHVFLAIIALAIIEQLVRNTDVRHRWAIKYLFIGAGGVFAFDFFLYVDALLFQGFDQELWEARGIVNLVAVPLLAISAIRMKDWSLDVFVSRDIILYTSTIAAGALYLLLIAGAGYYLREYGGSWGQIIQVLFLSLAAVVLLTLLFSGWLRARVRVFLGKHFYRNKYDYRREWLRLTGELSDQGQEEGRLEVVVRVLAQIVDARAGLLWLREDQVQYRNAVAWNVDWVKVTEPGDGGLVRFLTETGYVINLDELESRADEYNSLDLPEWLATVHRPWLIVPLFGQDSLLGFVVLAEPLIDRSINWEDRDLLKTAANQVAGYVAALRASEALAEAKQFEVFNRLSAFMVHDLKNIAAELKLVALNAEKHKHNPGFLEDAFATVQDAAVNINRLLEQMRNRRIHNEKQSLVDLGKLISEVIETRQKPSPQLQLDASCDGCFVVAEKGRLANVLAHLIDNAQQATGAGGVIEVTLQSRESMHILEIRDNGRGMDADFIRNRLFRPFDTTKGNAGLGIGMYESREFIHHIGGEIHVQSEPGKGTTVSLHLPAGQTDNAPVSVIV